MTVTQAQRARHARFLPGRAALAGLAAGMLAAFTAQAAPASASAALPLMAASTLPSATDPARQQGFEAGLAEYRGLEQTFPALGYELVELPKVAVPARADFVLASLSI